MDKEKAIEYLESNEFGLEWNSGEGILLRVYLLKLIKRCE